MALPLVVAAVPTIIAWARGALAAGGLVHLLTSNSAAELWEEIKVLIVAEVARVSGLHLDPGDPFSDASMAGAVGQRVGFPLRSLKDPAIIREDLDAFAVGVLEQKSGYRVRSLQNVAMLKEDLLQIGLAEASGRLGLPVGVFPGPGEVFDPSQIRTQLLTWAKAELMNEMGGEVAIVANDILGVADLPALASELNSRLSGLGSDENVSARQLAVRMASELATGAIVDYQKMAQGASKRSRRQESLRIAQAKFRATHGNRQRYIPLDMTSASI